MQIVKTNMFLCISGDYLLIGYIHLSSPDFGPNKQKPAGAII